MNSIQPGWPLQHKMLISMRALEKKLKTTSLDCYWGCAGQLLVEFFFPVPITVTEVFVKVLTQASFFLISFSGQFTEQMNCRKD